MPDVNSAPAGIDPGLTAQKSNLLTTELLSSSDCALVPVLLCGRIRVVLALVGESFLPNFNRDRGTIWVGVVGRVGPILIGIETNERMDGQTDR